MSQTVTAIEGAILHAAHESLGIYPQSVVGGDKPYEKRTDWMEGWNAAVMRLSEAQVAIGDWFEALGESERPAVEALLVAGRVTIESDGEQVALSVGCSDTFYWGCADAEPITVAEMPALAECYALVGDYGGELWCARKRGMRPQRASYKECYPPETWPLFDACGPERDPKSEG